VEAKKALETLVHRLGRLLRNKGKMSSLPNGKFLEESGQGRYSQRQSPGSMIPDLIKDDSFVLIFSLSEAVFTKAKSRIINPGLY
jgi:hypothetical protein